MRFLAQDVANRRRGCRCEPGPGACRSGPLGLKNGKVLLVFPEGTRTIDGHLGEFKKGSAILACELGVPVVPVGLKGAYEMWPRGGKFRRHASGRRFSGNRLIPNGSAALRIPIPPLPKP